MQACRSGCEAVARSTRDSPASVVAEREVQDGSREFAQRRAGGRGQYRGLTWASRYAGPGQGRGLGLCNPASWVGAWC
jgi:hypothetical protein